MDKKDIFLKLAMHALCRLALVHGSWFWDNDLIYRSAICLYRNGASFQLWALDVYYHLNISLEGVVSRVIFKENQDQD